jgi:hypothetical protein
MKMCSACQTPTSIADCFSKKKRIKGSNDHYRDYNVDSLPLSSPDERKSLDRRSGRGRGDSAKRVMWRKIPQVSFIIIIHRVYRILYVVHLTFFIPFPSGEQSIHKLRHATGAGSPGTGWLASSKFVAEDVNGPPCHTGAKKGRRQMK